MADDKRTDYFRQRRQRMKQIVFLIDKDKGEALDATLAEKGIGRTEWFRRVVDREIGEKE